MSADIVERLEYARTQLEDDVLDFLYLQGGNDSKRYKTAQAINVLLREAAAEIGRLRGELAVANECLGDERAANVLRTPAPAMPNGVEGLLSQARAVLERLRAQDDDAATVINRIDALRAADNRDAAGAVPAWIATWMADREILPDDDGDGISEGALVEALNNHERELLNAHSSACELGAVRELVKVWRVAVNGASTTNKQDLRPERFIRELEAALQHRGDSRGGEG